MPAQCAALLHEGRIDLGLIPAIEYLRGDYRIVPGVAIGSDGEIASVAVFSRVPVDRIATLALDISSRTSVALTRILCARRLAHRAEAGAGRARSAQHAGAGRRGARDWRSGA